MGEEVVLVGLKRGKLLEIEDMDRKGQRTKIFCRFYLLVCGVACIWNIQTFSKTKFKGQLYVMACLGHF